MFVLNQDGSSTNIECDIREQRYGCTSYEQDINHPYPFPTNPVQVEIDGSYPGEYPYDTESKAYNRYLWDVVTQELGLHLGSQDNKPLAAVEAQAIATRTYAFHRGFYVGEIDNSALYHVYIPFSYDVLLNSAAQQTLRDGMARRLYLTESNTTYPIDAQYGADNGAMTSEGAPTYVSPFNSLHSVADPISAEYGVLDGTERGGMSSKGASRWAFGHTSSRGPVAADQPNYPNDSDNLGDFWSVAFDRSEQILTHYYTGIHLRDANNASTILTARYRWVPLQITWRGTLAGMPPTTACAGQSLTADVLVQNTGTEAWNSVGLFESGGQQTSAVLAAGVSSPQTVVQPGETTTLALRITAPGSDHPQAAPYAFAVDMRSEDQGDFFDFSAQNPSWSRYQGQIPALTVVTCDPLAYLPLVQGDAAATTLSQ